MSNDRIGQCALTPSVRDIRTGVADDPRVAELRTAVARLCRELAAYPFLLPERHMAQEELALLDARAADGTLSVPGLRASLLVVAGALGSVSSLGAALGQVRGAIDLFGRV